MKEKNSYEKYAKEICKECINRLNQKDLCKITKRGNITKCDYYERSDFNKQ